MYRISRYTKSQVHTVRFFTNFDLRHRAKSAVLEWLMLHAMFKLIKCMYTPTSCCQRSLLHMAKEIVNENECVHSVVEGSAEDVYCII